MTGQHLGWVYTEPIALTLYEYIQTARFSLITILITQDGHADLSEPVATAILAARLNHNLDAWQQINIWSTGSFKEFKYYCSTNPYTHTHTHTYKHANI